MSQSRAKASQTLKSLSHLYKVCGGTNGSQRYCSSRFVKSNSCVKGYATLSSASVNDSFDFQNPNEFSPGKNPSEYGNNSYFRGGSDRFDQNPNPNGFSSESFVNQNRILQHTSNSNRLYEEGRNVQNSYRVNDGNWKQTGTQSNYNYNVDGQSNKGFDQVAGVGSGQHFATDQQHDEKPDEDGRLRGTIEEFDAFCKEGKLKEAVEVLGLLEQHNISVDVARYLFLMNEIGEAQALQEAKHVHEHLTRSVLHLDVRVCNKILEMYAKCGSMEDAYKVFDKMSQRNLTSWDTMITWFAKNGHGEDAIDMFNEFKKIGLKPDNQMFFGVFNACSVVGDMREGLLHFESMSKDYNIDPSLDHYRSVVDMLGSAGYLNEALEFIENMPVEPSVEVWETMMNQCRIHGDTELGDRCTELIELLDPSCLDEQSKAGLIPVKASDIAREKEKKRLSGFNPLEIKTKVYEYRAGDTSHPEHEKLYSQLRCLRQPMKEAGYVPEVKFVLHDVDQESKEEALLSHSERLALSQALLTSPARSPVRIIKNLRVCGDCHNALKIISKLVGRLIVARDAKRFHHFENGVCSCGDYW